MRRGANRRRQRVLCGVTRLTDAALQLKALEVDIFAEVGPNQKQRILRSLKRTNLGVAYLGDGINDAGALRSADVGISVESAVDATKEAADIVLVTKDLNILLDAVVEGRRAFGNTLTYILISTSANFGNMFSVVGASLFADFLPLLPAVFVLLVIRTQRPFWRSPIGEGLLSLSLFVVVVAVTLPHSFLAAPLGFEPMPISYVFLIGLILVTYVLSSEEAKILLKARADRSRIS